MRRPLLKRASGQLTNLRYLFVPRAKPLPELPPPDIILAADCVYFEPAFPLLISTLSALVSPPAHAPEVLFCYKKRRKADKRFFSLLKKSFTWSLVRD